MSHAPILIYGANGRAGTRIRRLAAERGVSLIVAGRNGNAIEHAAREGGHEARVFGLETPSTIDACLEGVHTVLHCAGPYRDTAMPMFEACLRTRVHYVDINNDFEVVEALRARSDEAAARGVMVLPCAGSPSVPADALAVAAAHAVASPTRLDVVHGRADPFRIGEPIAGKVWVREAHRLKLVRNGSLVRRFRCGEGTGQEILATVVNGTELTLAHEATGIEDIAVWSPVTRAELLGLRTIGLIGTQPWVERTRKLLGRLAPYVPKSKSHGTHADAVETLTALAVFVANGRGEVAAFRIETPDTETLTSHAALQVVLKVAGGHFRPGFQTVASLLGQDFVLSLPGVKRQRLI